MNSQPSGMPSVVLDALAQKVVGQPGALELIVPYVQMHQGGLAPQGRPIGVFLLLGPTGTGKTRTVEVMAEVLHGSHQRYLRVDCGEFQLDHEVARLVGAPPGYLGHGETKPLLSQRRLTEATSPACDISLVLFDEIEKAAPSLTQLLLGVFDQARLRLGDNTDVNFEKSLIFLTSNLGAREMMRELHPSLGFTAGTTRQQADDLAGKLEEISLGAVRKRFSPEFVNRIDAVVTYQPLGPESLAKILDQQIEGLQNHVNTRLGERAFTLELTPRAKEFLIQRGTSTEYGARELKRVVHRFLTQPLATLVAERRISAGHGVVVDTSATGEKLALDVAPDKGIPSTTTVKPRVLIVDDNVQLLTFVAEVLQAPGREVLTVETGEQALEVSRHSQIDVALVDYMLPDMDGLKLSTILRSERPALQAIIMTGAQLSSEEEDRFARAGLPILQKPFPVEDALEIVRSRLLASRAFRASSTP
jgi:ATP-dependent Clp protease ATP-binding subunit ClpA